MIQSSIDFDWAAIDARLSALVTTPAKRAMLDHLLAGVREDAINQAPGAVALELVTIAVILTR